MVQARGLSELWAQIYLKTVPKNVVKNWFGPKISHYVRFINYGDFFTGQANTCERFVSIETEPHLRKMFEKVCIKSLFGCTLVNLIGGLLVILVRC